MRFLALLFLASLSITLQAQKGTLLLVQQDPDSGLPSIFIDETGARVFSLPVGDSPITTQREDFLYWSESTEPNALAFGACVVQRKDYSYYLVNRQGKLIKDLGKQFHRMRGFSDGYCLAWEAIENSSASMLIYLDNLGNNAFSNKKFWEARPFKDGLAAVQPEKGGPWGYIDKTGEMVITLDPTIPGTVHEINPFYDGLARLMMKVDEPKGDYDFHFTYYYIDRTGKVAIDLQKLYPDRHFGFVANFSEGTAMVALEPAGKKDPEVAPKNDIVLLDTKGKQIRLFADANTSSGHHSMINGMGSIMLGGNDRLGEQVFFRIKGKDVVPVYDEDAVRLFYPSYILPDYYIIMGVRMKDGSPTSRRPCYFVFSRKTNKIVYDIDGFISAIYRDMIFVKKEDSQTCELVKLPGKKIWHTAPSDLLYKTIAQAMPAKDIVRFFSLESDQQATLPTELFQLINMERLTLAYSDFNAIPADISKLNKLKRLELISLEKLESLSPAITKLQELEELKIWDCGRLSTRDVEWAIEYLPALKKVELINFSLSYRFRDKIKRLKPALEIESRKVETLDVEDGSITFDTGN